MVKPRILRPNTQKSNREEEPVLGIRINPWIYDKTAMCLSLKPPQAAGLTSSESNITH